MERRQNQPQAFGFCHRLYNFLMNSLVGRGLKRVTLGSPKDQGSTQERVATAPRNGAADNNIPIEEVRMNILAHGKPNDDVDSQVKIEFEQANGLENSSTPALKRGSAIVGGSQTQVQMDPPRMIPVEDQGSKGDNKDQASRTVIGQNHDDKNVSNGKSTNVTGGAQKPVNPITHITNINERSAKLIERTKKALRNSSDIELRTP